MQDRIRKVLSDLDFLSRTLSGTERERILETISLFRGCDEQDDYFMSLYKKLSSESGTLQTRPLPD
jgi:hypothetical protein